MKRLRALCAAAACIALIAACVPCAHAHTPLLSVLVLQERVPGEFIARWKRTEGITDPGAAYDLLEPVFPDQCSFTPPRLVCGERGLSGRIGFDGLANLSTSGMIEIQRLDGTVHVANLTAAQPHIRISETAQPTHALRSMAGFIWTGMTHIWLGLDHLTFVLGVVWLVSSWRVLIQTVTAFTIAHSFTLAAATFGLDGVPAAPVEATIALSIAFIAMEIAREARARRPSFTRQRPWSVAFAFGLLHGFGFAGALAELEIAGAELPVALLGFNVGVEIGQLLFIAVLLALGPVLRRIERASGVQLSKYGYYALGTAGMYWFFDRIEAFFPGL